MEHTDTGRLDVTTSRVFAQPPEEIDAAADRRARLCTDAGHILLWIATAIGLVMVAQIVAVRAGWEPTGWQWPASWAGFFGGLVVAIVLVRLSERARKVTGFPVPQELHETVDSAAESVRQLHELFEMVDAYSAEPQWTEKMTRVTRKQLTLLARQCELAHRAQRWRMSWMLSYRARQTAKLAVPLHETTANVAKGVLDAAPPEQ